MAEAVSSHEFLRQQGATFVVFYPCQEQLVLGLGCNETPAVVPQCVAWRRRGKDANDQGSRSPATQWPNQQAFEALLQVHKLLHLPPPPKPHPLQQHQQPTTDSIQEDAFKAAKAGLVSQKQVPEGSDGFIWLDDKQQDKMLQQQQQQRRQQQQQQQAATQQPDHSKQKLPCFAGGQVPALWPPDAYEATWLMTTDNHIAGMDTLPQHLLLDRFEAAWGWALHLFGLPQSRCKHLSAVLAVPIDMTAAEVRLLADLLLGRLGFAALLVHLEPVAACFGNGTTSACVVNIGSSSCSVCCVDDAVVLPPLSSRQALPYGLADLSSALTGWMGCYGHWPAQLQQRGVGVSSSGAAVGRAQNGGGGQQRAAAAAAAAVGAGGGGAPASSRVAGGVSPGGVYTMLLLEDLVLQQCYFPKENYQPGLLGQAMLEDQQPAVVPVRTPGQPTTNYSVSLGSWAAAAAMALFLPALAPSGAGSSTTPQGAATSPGRRSSGGGGGGDSSSNLGPGVSSVKQEPGVTGQEDSGTGTIPAAPVPPPAAGAAAVATAAPAAAAGQEAGAACLYRRYHAGVLELPAAETLHMQSQLKVRLESGETDTPPDGMYLLPVELNDRPLAAGAAAVSGGGGSGGGGSSAQGDVKLFIAAAAGAAGPDGPKDCRRSSSSMGAPSIGVDEAVYRCIMAASAGRPELTARLAAGLLLVGPGGGLRGLGSMLERRVGQRFAAAKQPQVVSTLEPRAEPAHVTWKGAALLAALDSGRENWLPRHQWVDGGMAVPAPKTAAAAVPAGVGSNCTAAAGRHTKLFYYCRAEQGL